MREVRVAIVDGGDEKVEARVALREEERTEDSDGAVAVLTRKGFDKVSLE